MDEVKILWDEGDAEEAVDEFAGSVDGESVECESAVGAVGDIEFGLREVGCVLAASLESEDVMLPLFEVVDACGAERAQECEVVDGFEDIGLSLSVGSDEGIAAWSECELQAVEVTEVADGEGMEHL